MARRQFHPSPARFSDEKQPAETPEVPKNPQGKRLQEITRDIKPQDFKPYTEEQKARLQEEYTPEQIAAIEAGEAAIDPKDLAEQFGIRKDPMKFKYLDDFSVIEPGIDKHVRAPESNSDYNARLKTEEDFVQDYARFFSGLPENATGADWVRFADSLRLTVGKEENELNPHSAIAPDLFGPGESLSGPSTKVAAELGQQQKTKQENGESSEEITDALKRLLLSTGYTMDTIRFLKLKTLVSHSVVNQTRLGKVRRQYCLSIAGNGNGLLGIGEAKSEESGDAMLQSKYRAIRNMQPIPRYEYRTIYGDVRGKVGAVELILMNRPPGRFLTSLLLKYS